MTEEGSETLAGMASSWLEEAQRLESTTPEPTLEQQIGYVLLQYDVAGVRSRGRSAYVYPRAV